MTQFRNLVFEGGGVKGIAYVGALAILEKKEILKDIQRIGGTSAGAINAVLLACGYSRSEQRKILSEMDFNRFMDDSFGFLRDAKRLIDEYGWYKGDYFREWIGALMADKIGSPHATFTDFRIKGRPDLYLVGANLSTGFAEVFSAEHTPTMRVVDAVRISMSLPLFFSAVRNVRGDVYVDGGLLNNYPIKLFDRQKYVDNAKAARKTEYYDAENAGFLKVLTRTAAPTSITRRRSGFASIPSGRLPLSATGMSRWRGRSMTSSAIRKRCSRRHSMFRRPCTCIPTIGTARSTSTRSVSDRPTSTCRTRTRETS